MKNKKIIIVIGICILLVAFLLILSLVLKNKTYEITFSTNGGTTVEKQEIKKGDLVVEPENPTKDGYVFEGWYYDNELFDFSTKVNSDITLEARWKEKTKGYYTVTFDSLGGSEIDSVDVKLNSSVTKPSDPTKDGFIFVEWQLNGAAYDFSQIVNSDITLVALWKVNEDNEYYTVTFDSNGGTKVTSQTVLANNVAVKPKDPTRNGYTFTGWTLNGKKFNFDTKIIDSITLKASWEKNNSSQSSPTYYTVTFDSSGGSSVVSQKVESNKTATKPSDPTRDGYTFVGWMLNGKNYNFSTKVTSNVTLVASWSKIIDVPQVTYYTVTFDSNGGSTVKSQIVEENTTVIKPSDPTRSGYQFNGWLLNGATYNFSTKVTSNITLVADWKEIITYTYSVKNDPQSDIQKLVYVYRNNTDISKDVLYIANSDGVNLGRYSKSSGAIIVNNNEIDNIAKIMYNNEFIAITKK